MTYEATAKIVEQIRAQGNRAGVISIFKTEMEMWARKNSKRTDAKAILLWLPNFQVRPFYSARELAPLMPALSLALGHTKFLTAPKSSQRLANELKFARLPVLSNSSGSSLFRHPAFDNILEEFFIVERPHFWREKMLKQVEFEKEFPK